MRLRSDRHFLIDAPIERVWAAIARPEDYMSWWPWLGFDARALDVGERWKCRVRSPLGHRLRFDVTLRAVTPLSPERRHDPDASDVADATAASTSGFVGATVAGDITGTAALTVERASSADRSGSERSTVHLVSDLEATGRSLQLISRALPPLARWCHDRVLDRGVAQFGRVVGTAAGSRSA